MRIPRSTAFYVACAIILLGVFLLFFPPLIQVADERVTVTQFGPFDEATGHHKWIKFGNEKGGTLIVDKNDVPENRDIWKELRHGDTIIYHHFAIAWKFFGDPILLHHADSLRRIQK